MCESIKKEGKKGDETEEVVMNHIKEREKMRKNVRYGGQSLTDASSSSRAWRCQSHFSFIIAMRRQRNW